MPADVVCISKMTEKSRFLCKSSLAVIQVLRGTSHTSQNYISQKTLELTYLMHYSNRRIGRIFLVESNEIIRLRNIWTSNTRLKLINWNTVYMYIVGSLEVWFFCLDNNCSWVIKCNIYPLFLTKRRENWSFKSRRKIT